MPRNPKFVALQKLVDAKTNNDRAKKASRKAQDTLYAAMVRAVEAGNTRGEVAKIVGVSLTRVAQTPGMPTGANTHKRADDTLNDEVA
jgi:hypothetical protein